MSFAGGSKSLGKDRQLTSLKIVGGKNANPQYTKCGADLEVQGGALIKKDAVVCGTLYTSKLEEKRVDDGIIVDAAVLSILEDAIVCGNLEVKGNIDTTSLSVLEDAVVCGNLEVKGTFTGNVQNMNIVSNTLVVDCVITDKLDLNCGNISNVEQLEVNTIISKGIDVGSNTLEDVVVFKSPPVFGVTTSGGGARNMFWGYQSGYATDGTAEDNVGMGYQALSTTTNEKRNVVIGSKIEHSSFDDNVIIGYNAKIINQSFAPRYFSSTGSIAIGSKAEAGAHSTVIGYNAKTIISNPSFASFNTIIGHNATGDAGCTIIGTGVSGAERAIRIGNYGTTGLQSVCVGCYSFSDINSISVGYYADSSNSGVALGYYTWSAQPYAITIGFRTYAESVNTISIGKYVRVPRGADDTVAIGTDVMTNFVSPNNRSHKNIAIGYNCLRDAGANYNIIYSTVLGYQACKNSVAYHYSDIVIGRNTGQNMGVTAAVSTFSWYNVIMGENAAQYFGGDLFENVVMGKNVCQNSNGIFNGCVIMGYNSCRDFNGEQEGTVILGQDTCVTSTANFYNSFGLGANAFDQTGGNFFSTIAVGDATMFGVYNSNRDIALGESAMKTTRESSGTIAIGERSFRQSGTLGGATMYHNIAIGRRSLEFTDAGSSNNIGIGRSCRILNGPIYDSIAIGRYSRIRANDSVAIGRDTKSYNNYSIAIGTAAKSDADDSIAIGRSADSNMVPNSISLGQGASPYGNAHPIALVINAAGITGAPGAATAGLGVTINGLKYLIPLTLVP